MPETTSVKDRYKTKTSTKTSTELVDKASSEAKNAGGPPTNTGSGGKIGLDQFMLGHQLVVHLRLQLEDQFLAHS